MRGESTCRVIVPLPARVVYDAFADVRSYPLWLDHIRSVRVLDARRSIWTMVGHQGRRMEWETEITLAKPAQRWAWSSTSGDLVTYAKVTLDALEANRTRITFKRFVTTSGRGQGKELGAWFADPDQKIRRDMERFVAHLKKRASGRSVVRLA